jgi:cyanophycin synthetase
MAIILLISSHRAQGKRAIFRHQDDLHAVIGNQIVRKIPLENIPLTDAGRLGFQIEKCYDLDCLQHGH